MLSKHRSVNATFDFSNFAWGRQGQKINIECFNKTSQENYDISVLKKNKSECWLLALLCCKRVVEVNSSLTSYSAYLEYVN